MANPEPMRVVVMTSDYYLPALRPFAWLLNKYYTPLPEVIVGGFTIPDFELPPNYHFCSIGRFADYPFNRWSDALIELLGLLPDEAILLMLEDYFITRPVDTRNLKILHHYALQFGYVLKIDVCTDRLYAYGADLNYSHVAHIDLIKSMPGSPYHMSLWPGIWRRDNLLKALVPGESPHDVELTGTTRVSHMQDMLVLGTRQNPIKITLGLRSRDFKALNLSEIDPEDVNTMRSLGYFKPWEEK